VARVSFDRYEEGVIEGHLRTVGTLDEAERRIKVFNEAITRHLRDHEAGVTESREIPCGYCVSYERRELMAIAVRDRLAEVSAHG
jgi:hypothetical protein